MISRAQKIIKLINLSSSSNTLLGRMTLSTISFNAIFYKSDKYEYWSYEKLSSSDMKFIKFQTTYVIYYIVVIFYLP